MIEHARAHRSVVRLKSGDPLIFGRAAEEMAALTEAGVAFEIVPGITAAFAAAAAIGCSLTDRNSASNVIFSTGHHAQSHNQSPLPEIEDTTRVVYMPGRDLPCSPRVARKACRRLPLRRRLTRRSPISKSDVPPSPPSASSRPPAPSLLIAGWAVREHCRAALQWCQPRRSSTA
jgi:hypothetical protein